ncbi:penicillin-binding protein 2 [Herbiconiux sp. CPCC 205763]|uniref:Penicillin-binding protein 2 n=1 Tax=Herbiconiux aconitum TaxID=2970913 RepID=A0ABT2GNU2_9MICO|nr:penicillin-binding protein 2 [Herbiconiux aconitum]MCS5717786.1 penicillin-binding protein 2 [Herbiconiux aconitum]
MPSATRRSTRRRTAIAGIGAAAIGALFVFRLVDIQVVRADALSRAASETRGVTEVSEGVRGDILDSAGTVLASTISTFTITVSPRAVADFTRERDTANGEPALETVTPHQAAGELAGILARPTGDILSILTDDPSLDFAYVARDIDATAFEAVKELEIPWLYYESEPERVYPIGSVTGNIVGFYDNDGASIAGVEQLENTCLSGSDGTVTYQRGADGVAIPGTRSHAVPPQKGGSVTLTIDSDLQWFAQTALAERMSEVGGAWGTAIVQRVDTGDLLAVADYPSVDPARIDDTPEQFRGSIAFQAPYEPGSTFKALTAASLVDAGVATAATEVESPFIYTDPNGASFRDSEFHDEPLRLTLAGVVQESSNTGLAILSKGLTPDQRFDDMLRFGLGEPSEVGFPGESGGILRTPAEWDNQTELVTTFGQGLSATAIQMASVYQTLGNQGVRMPVRLVAGCSTADGAPHPKGAADGTAGGVRVISADTAQSVVEMLETVVEGGYAASELQLAGYRVAAKTSTAEMSDGNGAYSSSFITSITGLFPAEAPQFVVSVTIAQPVSVDSALAPAPVFHDLVAQLAKDHRVLPSTEPAPELPTRY